MFKNNSFSLLSDALERLEQYIEDEQYKGYDPYDVLKSPVFQLPVLRSSKVLRFGAQQLFRRLPINLRPMLGIAKGLSPVTLGCCIQGYAYRMRTKGRNEATYVRKAEALITKLESLQATGYSGSCWGYEFDWQGRYANIPADTPTVVATGFITNGLFEYYRVSGSRTALRLCTSAADFVLNDLQRTCDGDTFCFSYSPVDRQRVFNASMKGARLLAQVFSVNGAANLKAAAASAVAYVARHQRADGSWGYATGDARTWSDNHHTAYVLDALHEYILLTGDTLYQPQLEKGLAYYLDNFFDGPVPKYYDKRKYPIDSTALAQSILTLLRFEKVEKATAVALWGINHMTDTRGFSYYQRHRWLTHKTSYMRWSNAWIYAALAALVKRF